MTSREKMLIHYVVVLMTHDDARRMSNTLRVRFTPDERREIKALVGEFRRLKVGT
jgi:hypothetical protein